MKLSTIQKRNNLNIVERMGVVGPGGAYHNYDIRTPSTPDEESLRIAEINFQCGPRKDPASTRGVLDVDLLEIVRDRLVCFQQGDFATRENAIALTHIEEALLWMNKRVEDRAERGVLGTNTK
jgi:hypothetical protein